MAFVRRDQRDLESNSYAAIPLTVSKDSPNHARPEKVPAFWLDTELKRFFVCTALNQVGNTEQGVWTRLGDVSSGTGSITIQDLQGGTATALAGDFTFNGTESSGILVSANGNTVAFQIRSEGIETIHIDDAAVTGAKIASATISLDNLTQSLRDLIEADSNTGIMINGSSVTAVTNSSEIVWTGEGASREAGIAEGSIAESKLAQAVVDKINRSTPSLQYNNQDVDILNDPGTGIGIDYDDTRNSITIRNTLPAEVSDQEFEELRDEVEHQKQLTTDLRLDPPTFDVTTDDVDIAFGSSSTEADLLAATYATTVGSSASARRGFLAMQLAPGLDYTEYVVELVDISVVPADVQARYFGNTFHRVLNAPGDVNEHRVLGLSANSSQEITIPANFSLRIRKIGHTTTYGGNLPADSIQESELSPDVRTKLNDTPPTVDEDRIFDTAQQKTDTVAKTALLQLVDNGTELEVQRQTNINTQAIANIDTSNIVPEILKDWGARLTETRVAGGSWTRVDPDPYADRILIQREYAAFEGENRTSTGSNQSTGNVFTDITPNITVTPTTPRFYADENSPTNDWIGVAGYDEQKVTVENATGETTPIQNIWGKILTFRVRVQNINNVPTSDFAMLRLGADDAHPMLSARRVGNNLNIYAETITARSAGSSTYTYNRQINADAVIIEGDVGERNNHDIIIPADWSDADHIRMRFFLFRVSDHTTFNTPQIVPFTTFDIVSLTTAVPDTTFTVSWTIEDGTTISTTYTASYPATQSGNGDYFMELSNASVTDNLGADYEAHVYIDRGTVQTHGATNTYTQELVQSMPQGGDRTFVATWYPNDDELTNANARLYMVIADSTVFRNNINLDRAIGEDGLAFNRISYNDIPNDHATAVAFTEGYSYTINPLVPSHEQLQQMWDNRGRYIGLFLPAETLTFLLDAIFRASNANVERVRVGSNTTTPDSDGELQLIAGANMTISIGTNSITFASSGGGGGTPTTSVQYNGQDVATVSSNATITLSYDSATENLNFAVAHPATITSITDDDGNALTPSNRSISIRGGTGITATRDQTNADHIMLALESDSIPNIQSISIGGTAVNPSAAKDINFEAGDNITATVVGNTITLSSTDTQPLIDTFSVDGTALTPDSNRGIGVTAGTNITLTVDPNNPENFEISAASPEAETKQVTTASFTSTEGTAGTPAIPAVTETNIVADELFQRYSVGGFSGSKTFDGTIYRLLSDVADNVATDDSWETNREQSSDNINELFDSRSLTSTEFTVLGWSGATARQLNTFRPTGTFTIQIQNVTTSTGTFPTSTTVQNVFLEIFRPNALTGTITDATLVHQMLLTDNTFRDFEVMHGDIIITAIAETGGALFPTIRLQTLTEETVELAPEVPAIPAVLGTTTKTTSVEEQSFDDVTSSRQVREDSAEKTALIERRLITLTNSESIPFLFLNNTNERINFGISEQDTANLVANPIVFVRRSYIEAFKTSETSSTITCNIRVVRDRAGTATTISETTEWTLRGKITSATDDNGIDVSDNLYYCLSFTDSPQNSDIYSLEGHTQRIELGIGSGGGVEEITFNGQPFTQLAVDDTLTGTYDSVNRRVTLVDALPGFKLEVDGGVQIVADMDGIVKLLGGTNATTRKDTTDDNTVIIDASGGGGSGGSKTVATAQFTVTDGTAPVENVPATYTDYQWAGQRALTGTKDIDSISYTARANGYVNQDANWETTATSSSPNISDIFENRTVGAAAMGSFGWSGVDAGTLRTLNTVSVAGSYQITNRTPATSSTTFPPATKDDIKTLGVEFWDVDTTSGRFSTATLLYQLILDDITYTDVELNAGTIMLVFELTDETVTTAPVLRLRQIATPAVEDQPAMTGSVTKTTPTAIQNFDALSFNRSTERDDTVNKAGLLKLQGEAVLEDVEVPFLFLERTLETTSVTIDSNMLNEFVNSPAISLRASIYREWNVNNTLNLRVDKVRGDTTTQHTITTFTNRGKVSGATIPDGNNTYEDYVCAQITDTDVQDGDVYTLYGHTRRLVASEGTLTYLGQPVRAFIEGRGIEADYNNQNRSLTVNTISGFAAFVLRYSSIMTTLGTLQANNSENTFNSNITYLIAAFDIDNSSVAAASYVERATANNFLLTGNAALGGVSVTSFRSSGRYEIEVSTDNVLVSVVSSRAATQIRGLNLNRILCSTNRFYSFYFPAGSFLITAPVRRVNNVTPEFNVDRFTTDVATSDVTEPANDRDIYYSLGTTTGFITSDYVKADQIELPDGTTFDISSFTTFFARLAVPSLTSVDSSGDISEIFNLITLTDAELTALNLSTDGTPDLDSFLEFNKSGSFRFNAFYDINYIIQVRPTRTNGLITSYTRVFSHITGASLNTIRGFDSVYIEAEDGDILLPFYYRQDSYFSFTNANIFSVGHLLSLGVNPSLTIERIQLASATYAGDIPGAAGNYRVIDFDNSTDGVANLFRNYIGIRTSGFDRFNASNTYTIARFNTYTTLDGDNGRVGNLTPRNETQVISGVSVGFGSDMNQQSIIDESGVEYTSFIGLTDLQLPSATYDALLVQDTSTTTNVAGYKYPNNGYDATASSSNITDIFGLKTLTQAEMRIFTGQTSGAFAASNTVLESKINGVITFQNGTATGATFATSSFLGTSIPVYDESGVLTGTMRPPLNVRRVTNTGWTVSNTTTVTQVRADSNGFWPNTFITVRVGDLLILYSSGTGEAARPIALAINAVAE